MEFTEVSEINDMIQYSKSFNSSSVEFSRNVYPKANNDTLHPIVEENNEDLYDYDQILQDSPRSTRHRNDPLEQLSDTLRLDEEEALETILEDIRSTVESSRVEDLSEIERNKNELNDQQNGEKYSSKEMNGDMIMEKPDSENASDSEMETEKRNEEQENGTERRTIQPSNAHAKSTKFERLSVDQVFAASMGRKSILSQTMKEQPKKHNAFTPSTHQRSGRSVVKMFKVYFWKTSVSLNILLNITATVAEVIRQIIDAYLEDSNVDASLMKYSKYIEAYELRMLENDDDYKPEMAFAPLEKSKPFIEYNIQKGVAFLEVAGFKPPEDDDKDNQSKYDKMEKLVTMRNKMLVHVIAVDEKLRSSLQIDPEEPIKALFPKLSAKIKNISSKTYQFKVYHADLELRALDKGNFLDINMPFKNLKMNKSGGLELEVVKRKFADDPADAPTSSKRHLSKAAELSQQLAQSVQDTTMENDENVFLYNDVSASHYEEFEVIKINPRGKKQTRVIGIDGFKMYNMSKKYKEQNMGLSGIFSTVFFSKFSTKHPERLLRDIKEARLKGPGNIFCIEVKTENNRPKVIDYEAPDKKTAQQIVAKLRYLKNLEQKNH